jgi:hypothetical protein
MQGSGLAAQRRLDRGMIGLEADEPQVDHRLLDSS